MAKMHLSTKRLQIDKANLNMVITVAVAAFLVIFSIFASRALLQSKSYQSRVIAEKSKAAKQLKANVGAVNSLVGSYKDFVNTTENVLGGNPQGAGDKDGDNAKIVLDALPSKYDFPALTSSLEKILNHPGYRIESIVGTDDEINQQNASSPNPNPIEIPFEVTVSGSYDSMKALLDTLQRSIRPFQVQSVGFAGNSASLRVTITATTYYQPEKNLNIRTKEVK